MKHRLPKNRWFIVFAIVGTLQLASSHLYAQLELSETHQNVSCFGGNNGSIDLTVTKATGIIKYQWSTIDGIIPLGQENQEDLTNLIKGTYDVIVTDDISKSQLSIQITEPEQLLLSEIHQNVSCFGGNNGSIDLTVSGGTAPYSYLWSNSATTEDISGLTAGTYDVVVTDNNGCTQSKSVTIAGPSAPLATTETHVNVVCFGNATGSINLSVTGGTTPYSYLWTASGGGVVPGGQQNNEDLTGLVAGTYSVLVTDANSCTTTKSITITQPASGITLSETHVNVLCFGLNTGSIDLTVSGGVAPYSFSWSASNGGIVPPGQQNNEDLTNLVAGKYTVVVTDQTLCTATLSITITQPSAALATTETHINVLCYGEATGSIDLTVTGGTPAYGYSWTASAGGNVPAGQQNNEDLTGLVTGIYTVIVTDGNGCTTFRSITITQPSSGLSTSETHVNVLCYGNATGSINLTVSGGTPGYTYLWTASGGGIIPGGQQNNEDLTGLVAGTYSVLVTDANSCTATRSITITQPANGLTTSETHVNVACFGNATGSIDLTVNGGIPPYAYSWSASGGGIVPGGQANNQDLTNLIAGTYTVIVSDASGCTSTRSVNITQPAAALSTTETHVNVLCYGNATGSINLTVTGGTTPYTFAWTASGGGIVPVGQAGNEDLTGLVAGTYSVLVTDANLCTTNRSITITQPAAALSLSETHINVVCYGMATGSIDLTVTGGTFPYTYAWTASGGGVVPVGQAGIQDLTGLVAGIYSVVVTDNNGCTATLSVTITQPASGLTVTASSNSPLCQGSTLTLLSNPSGGVLPYSYSWTGPNGFNSILQNPTILNATPAATGTYTITVKDFNNCTAIATTMVNVYPTLTQPSIASDQTICYNTAPISLTISIPPTGGTGTYSYQWQSSATGGAPWISIPGATGSTYSPGNLTSTIWYRLEITSGPCGPLFSVNTIKITVQPLLAPGSITANQTICYNTIPNNLTSTDNGGNAAACGTPVWKWEYSIDGGTTWNLSATTTSGYIFLTPLTQTTQFRRSSGYFCGNVYCYSNPATPVTITVIGNLNPGTIAADQTICDGGDPALLTSTSDPSGGNPPLTIQWQVSTDGSIYSDITGANGLTYDPPILNADRWYRRAVTSTQNGVTCTAVSNVVKVTVNNITSAGGIIDHQILCVGETAGPFTSTAPAASDGTITYQWQRSTISAITGFTDIIGATNLTYTPPTPPVNTWYRRLAVSTLNEVVCTLPSNVLHIYLGIFNAGTILPAGNDTIFCAGENPGIISGTAFSAPPPQPVIQLVGYRWQSNTTGNPADFANIPGATNQDYDPPVINVTTWYRRITDVVIEGHNCSGASNTVVLRAYPVPNLTVSSPVETCERYTYTITATATGIGGTPVYTLTYNSGTYITPPATQTNTTGIFVVPVPAPPELPPVGQQNFTVSVTNGDPGACSASKPVVVHINDVPNITLTASCASNTTGLGSIMMTGVVTYPAAAGVEYMITPPGTSWTTNPLFENLPMGTYLVTARNSLAPTCTATLMGQILALSASTNDYEICQNTSVPPGQGLSATSYCFRWGNANAHTGDTCTNASSTYIRSNTDFIYTAGTLVQYKVYAVVQAPLGTLHIKDCPYIDGSYSVYLYPFDAANPSVNFLRLFLNTCPGGTGCEMTGLDPAAQYVIVLNSSGPNTTVCSQVIFDVGDKAQVAVDISPIQWFLSESGGLPIHTGTPWDPTTTAGSGVTSHSCPGTYTFYAGCATGVCREPAFFIIDPAPIVQYHKDTICSGGTTAIPLISKDSCNNPVDPSRVTYEWTASVLSGSATGFSNCTTGCGSTIIQQLTSTSNAVCPVVRYMVRGKVGNCYGAWYPVDVLIINSNSITPPTPPPNITYTCLNQVPPPGILTAQHACLGTLTATGVDVNNGGTGCPSNPLVITRTWTFHDACVNIVVSQIIRVNDSIPPTFTQPPNANVYTDAACSYSVNPLYTGDVTNEADNCSTGLNASYSDAVANGPCQGEKVITRTWLLVDACGNSTSKFQFINVLDTIKPTFTRPPDKIVNSDTNCAYNISVGITGDVTDEHDNCSTGLQATYSDVVDNSNPCLIMVYRTWSLVDNCGNAAASQVQTITVKDVLPPTFTRPPNTIIYTDANCNYDADPSKTGDVTNEHDNCATGLQATYTDVIANGPCEGTHVITRTWHLADPCGNVAPNQVQIITVSDSTRPTFNRPADAIIYADNSCNYNASTTVTGDVTNVHDNCSTGIIATYSDAVVNGSCIGEKIISRTWSLVDHCGNAAFNQVQTITVLDTIRPAFTSLPPPVETYCVIDIIEADFYPDTMDITPVRPDYHILSTAEKAALDLNPATFWDNCTPPAGMILHWRIDFNGGVPPPIAATGQVSAYGGIIQLPGDRFVNITHTITYWLEDSCHNIGPSTVVQLIVKPRPDVIKIY